MTKGTYSVRMTADKYGNTIREINAPTMLIAAYEYVKKYIVDDYYLETVHVAVKHPKGHTWVTYPAEFLYPTIQCVEIYI